MVKQLTIAGTHSGVGKTTIVVGLIAALRRRGLVVQPFKVGPDYIDPSHHARAAGRPCRNLDTWMLPAARVQALARRAAAGADIALIEGVMGLHDGSGYEDDCGSTAEVAKLLQAPVVLVIDASRMARSAAALVLGYQRFDPALPLAGVILNRVGSDKHAEGLTTAIAAATCLPVLGALPRDQRLHVPERHLGLVPSHETGAWEEMSAAAADVVERCLDLDRLRELAGVISADSTALPCQACGAADRPVIAVARDEAFHFTYEDNLDLLRAAGAELAYFSPLHDAGLPAGTAGIVLSGGFPEVFAPALAANKSMQGALRTAAAAGLPLYAECGGLMYLTEAIVDHDGRRHPMLGILPGHSVMTRRVCLGYRRARALRRSWLFEAGEEVRGHEFHYSAWHERPADLDAAYLLQAADGRAEPWAEGAQRGNVWASYVHLHFGAKPELAARFVSACARVPLLVGTV
jgi:cobyrinic acid a,c-diamide synthase